MRHFIEGHEIGNLYTPAARERLVIVSRQGGKKCLLYAVNVDTTSPDYLRLSRQAFAVFLKYPAGWQEANYGHPLDNRPGDYDVEMGTREIPAGFE